MTCDGTGDSDHRYFALLASKALDRLVPFHLAKGPATTTELREMIGPLRIMPDYHFGGCGARLTALRSPDACKGHTTGYTMRFWFANDIGYWLKKAEKAGLVTRVVIPGVQRHLWALKEGTCRNSTPSRASTG